MARSAADSVKDCLQKVKVSKTDAQALERELQSELLDSYTEKCEVSEARAIPVEDISEFLDHMQGAYEVEKHNAKEQSTWRWPFGEKKGDTSKEAAAHNSEVKTVAPEKKVTKRTKNVGEKIKPEDVILENWKEKCEVTIMKDIELKNIQEFLDYLKDTYEGIDESAYEKLKAIDWKSAKWNRYAFDVKPTTSKGNEAKYALLLFAKGKRRNSFNCAIANYRLSFEVSKAYKDRIQLRSLLYNFLRWNIESEESFTSSGGVDYNRRFKNFVYVKCLEGLKKEGIEVDIPE